jgi:hypothetical protein
MTASVMIPAHCNGPRTSGNGGYSCGLLAGFIEGPARVRLHVPPPLETELKVSKGEGDAWEMRAGETLVGTAWPAEFALDVPPAPALEVARDASTRFACFEEHDYPHCYVCGPQRLDDGLCIFPGPVDDWSLLACAWQPRPEMLDEQGFVSPEVIWSALDCPGYFAAVGQQRLRTLLGELSVSIFERVPGAEPLVVYCWPLGNEGRKRWGGAAIADAQGRVLAASHSLWIALKDEESS